MCVATAAGTLMPSTPDLSALVAEATAQQAAGEHQLALTLFERVLEYDVSNRDALNGMGLSLKTLGFADAAVQYLSAAVRQDPESAALQANLAGAQALAGREEEAVDAYQRALALDPYDPALHDWYNNYLGVMGSERYLDSYREVLAERPGDALMAISLAHRLILNHRELEALTVLDGALEVAPQDATLHTERSHALREAGSFDEALESARRAVTLSPQSIAARQEWATALMAAAADYEAAVRELESLVSECPEDQGLWALYATALRYAGHEQAYRALVDYDRWVQAFDIEAPEDYASVADYLADLRLALLALHNTRTHPAEQSMVGGTQTLDDLFSRRDPHVQWLASALYEQLFGFANRLPNGEDHPLLSRNTGDIEFADSWSVRLLADGFHKNHFHPEGWLSSAFYVWVPDSVAFGGAGWLKFGEPGFRAREPLMAEYWMKPRPGQLAVFPSYLWHGVEPVAAPAGGAVERITVGYDLRPRHPKD